MEQIHSDIEEEEDDNAHDFNPDRDIDKESHKNSLNNDNDLKFDEDDLNF